MVSSTPKVSSPGRRWGRICEFDGCNRRAVREYTGYDHEDRTTMTENRCSKHPVVYPDWLSRRIDV